MTACARRLGARRTHFTTADTVADLDDLRRALRAPRLSLLGTSYGTFVAERYALAHPRRTGRLVLDSVVPHAGVVATGTAPLRAAGRVLRAVCRARRCPGDPAADLAVVVRRDRLGVELYDALTALSVQAPAFPGVPEALHAARGGDPAPLRALLAAVARAQRAPAGVLSQGLHAATLCAESRFPWPVDLPVARRSAPLARARAALGRPPAATAPFDAATATGNGFVAQCRPWPPVPRPAPVARDLPRRAGAAAGRRPRPLHAAGLGARGGRPGPARAARRRAGPRPRRAAPGRAGPRAPGRRALPAGRLAGRGRGADPRRTSRRPAGTAGSGVPAGRAGTPSTMAPGATSAVTTARTPTRAPGPTATPRRTTAAVSRRAPRPIRTGGGDEALTAHRELGVGDDVVEVEQHDLVAEPRLRPDVDALVRRDDAAGAQPRARPDHHDGAGGDVEPAAGTDRAPVGQHDRGARRDVPGDAAPERTPGSATTRPRVRRRRSGRGAGTRAPYRRAAARRGSYRCRPAASTRAPAEVLAQEARRARCHRARARAERSGSASASGEPGTVDPGRPQRPRGALGDDACPSAVGCTASGRTSVRAPQVAELDDHGAGLGGLGPHERGGLARLGGAAGAAEVVRERAERAGGSQAASSAATAIRRSRA